LLAGRGVGRHHALPDRKPFDILAYRDYIAGQLVPEHRRGNDHPGMISTAKDLDVGAAGQRHLHSYENVSAIDCRNGYRLYLQVFLAVKHGSHHVAVHYDHLCG
jgi:hypothetical protein